LLDVEPLAEDILELLQARTDLHRLDPKFALQLDGGERAAMLEHPHDLWLAALPDGEHFAFGLAGCPPLVERDAPALAAVPVHAALELVEAVLLQFLECAQPEQTRMRHLLTTLPATEFLARLQTRLSFPLRVDAALSLWRRPAPAVDAHIGIHAQRERGLCYVGAVPTLGRIDSAQLHALAALAQAYDGELRFTPWQSILLVNIAEGAAPRLARELQNVGLCCDPRSVLAHTIACSGATGCAKGLADTKNDARQLSELLQRRIDTHPGASALPSVHLTGCERSCAAAHRADFTLLAQAPGRYVLYRRADGCTGFGCMLAQTIDIDTAATLIADACLVQNFTHDPEVDA
jgi:precorrin-3B synthase